MGSKLERLGDEIGGDIYLSLTDNISLGAGAGGLVGSLATNVINHWDVISTSQLTSQDLARGIVTSGLVGIGVYAFASACDYIGRKIRHLEN